MKVENPRWGFTLIEVILVIVLVTIIAAGFGQVFVNTSRAYVATDNRKGALQNGRWALDRMTREIRLVNNNTSVVTANASTFSFVDVNADTVTFSYDGATRQINRSHLLPVPGTDVLASNVDIFSFTYLDNTGASLGPCPPLPCSPSAIWRVQINAETLVNGERVVLQTEVHPRRV